MRTVHRRAAQVSVDGVMTDIGLVGDVDHVNTEAVLRSHCGRTDSGGVHHRPDTEGRVHNINAADTAAAANISREALGAEKLLMLTDVERGSTPGLARPRLRFTVSEIDTATLDATAAHPGGRHGAQDRSLPAPSPAVPGAHVVDGRVAHCVPVDSFDEGNWTKVTKSSRARPAEALQRWSAVMMNNYGTRRLRSGRRGTAVVTDADGKTHLDLLGGIAVNILGHRHPAIIEGRHRPTEHPGARVQPVRHRARGRAGQRPWSASSAPTYRRGCSSATPAPRPTRVALQADAELTGRTQTRYRTERLPRPHDGIAGTHRPARASRRRSEPLPGFVTHVPYGDVDDLRAGGRR